MNFLKPFSHWSLTAFGLGFFPILPTILMNFWIQGLFQNPELALFITWISFQIFILHTLKIIGHLQKVQGYLRSGLCGALISLILLLILNLF